MADNKDLLPRKYDVNAKWDACLDLSVRRFVYSSLASAFGESPVTRWASVAFGAGIGIGSAYTDCSRTFDVSSAMLAPPKPVDAPAPSPAAEDAQERDNPVEVKVLNPDFSKVDDASVSTPAMSFEFVLQTLLLLVNN